MCIWWLTEPAEEHGLRWEIDSLPHHRQPDQGGVILGGHRQSAQHG